MIRFMCYCQPFYIWNLFVLPSLLGCRFGSKQGQHCVTVCVAVFFMLYAQLPFFTAAINLYNRWQICCSVWLVVHFHTPFNIKLILNWLRVCCIWSFVSLLLYLTLCLATMAFSYIMAKMRCHIIWVTMLQYQQLFFIHLWNYSMLLKCG